MITRYIRSVGLKKGAPCGLFATLDELAASAGPGKNGAEVALELANQLLAQKGALVDCRDYLAGEVAKTFPMKTKNVTVTFKDGKTETRSVPDETEKDFIQRFRAAAAKDSSLTGGQDVEDYLQGIVDAHGPFNVSAAKQVRTGSGVVKLAAKYIAAATNIINNNSQQKWIAKFTEEEIPFGDFQTADASANVTTLARAIKEREDRRAAAEYA